MQAATHLDLVEALRGILEGFPGWSDIAFQDDNLADYRVRAKVHAQPVEFRLDVKSGGVRPEVVSKVLAGVNDPHAPLVLGMAWIPAKRAMALREQGVSYLDTAGNAFLDLPGLQVFRETIASPVIDPVRNQPHGGPFNASAVQVGLQLLLRPGLVASNLRRMAAFAGVSAPSAKFALDAFKADGYVVDAGQLGRRLVDQEAFFRKWADSYNQRYRPRHVLGSFLLGRSELSLDDFDACWGGEAAADRLTQNLRPAEQLLYCYTRKIGPLVARNRLRPGSEGNVELVEACWDRAQEEPQGTAPAFVVFADLLHTRDPRCIETAERIFDTILRERLRAHGE